MKTIGQQLADLGFTPGPDFARSDYRRDGLYVEIFHTEYCYTVATIPGEPCVWCGAHFPLTMPVADAVALVSEHQQAIHAAVRAAIAAIPVPVSTCGDDE